MEIIPVRTRVAQPPHDDLFEVLRPALPRLEEQDILLIASKVVSIHEGRCMPDTSEENRHRLIQEESEHIIPTETPNGWDLTIKHHMVAFAGGIDESNAANHLILLPEDPTGSARKIRERLCAEYNLRELGVIITDSTGLPFRQGVIGISIGHAGFVPVENAVGTSDLFGRPFANTYLNVVDSLAVAGAFVMGETNESTPACVIRNAPHVTFTDDDRSAELLIRPEDDVYYPVFKDTYPQL